MNVIEIGVIRKNSMLKYKEASPVSIKLQKIIFKQAKTKENSISTSGIFLLVQFQNYNDLINTI